MEIITPKYQDLVCDTSPRSRTEPPSFPSSSSLSSNLTNIFGPVAASNPGLVWQYWVDTSGRERLYPAWGSPGRTS